MLLDSPRLTDEDRRVWALAERADLRRARALDGRIERARTAIAEFAGTHQGAFVGVSWGKDSVVVAHLARTVDPTIPIAHEARGEWESPEAGEVRDAYLAGWPMPYTEIRFEPVLCPDGYVRAIGKYRALASAMGAERITGVRAAESGQRAEVFGYLARFDLPVHPAYAMTMGGRWDRDRLRVAPLFGERGLFRREWEEHYYPDHALRLRAALASVNGP